MAFEEAFELEIPDEDAEKIATVKDAVSYIENKSAQQKRRGVLPRSICVSRRVVVTGVGLVSSVGIGTEATWQGVLAGKSGIGPITAFDAHLFSCRIAGQIEGFDPGRYIEKKEIKKMGRFIQFAIAAADCAIGSAGLRVDPAEAENVGVYIGSGIGGFEVIEREHLTLLQHGPRRISPFFIPATIVNLASGYVSIRTGAKGPNSATATACTTSSHSIGDSFRLIQRGDADVMICGGTEACITPMGIGGFAAMRALSTRNDEPQRASRPWDLNRDGFVVGEGSGILVLEELEHARRRGARILAETAAIKRCFGEHAYKVAVSSTKSMTGHLLGGAGGLEAGITVLAIRDQVAPPTINYETPDPDCDLDYVPNKARPMRIDCALSNSFGFGGTNGALIFKRYSD